MDAEIGAGRQEVQRKSKDEIYVVKEGMKLIVVREEGGDVRVKRRQMIGCGRPPLNSPK